MFAPVCSCIPATLLLTKRWRAAEPNQKTAVVPTDKDQEAAPEDVSASGRSHSEQVVVSDSQNGSAHAAKMNGHAVSTQVDRLPPPAARSAVPNGNTSTATVQTAPSANPKSGHTNSMAADLERGLSAEADQHKAAGHGMVLPFSPITVTFRDLHYFVPLPEVRTQTSTRLAFETA